MRGRGPRTFFIGHASVPLDPSDSTKRLGGVQNRRRPRLSGATVRRVRRIECRRCSWMRRKITSARGKTGRILPGKAR